jgi:hypothetical protein
MPEIQDILLTTSQMIALFKITRQGLSRWVERGMPKRARNEYSQTECLEWIKTNIWFVGVGKGDLAEEKLKFQRARTRREELRAAQEEGNSIPREEILQLFLDRISVVKSGLLQLHRTLVYRLTDQPPHAWSSIIKGEVYAFLTRFSRPSGHLQKERRG